MKKDDQYRLARIVETGRQLLAVLDYDGITPEQLVHDFRLQWLVTTPLYNIGEQVYALSRTFKDAHPDIEWAGISGMRHHLVHDYEGTNWTLISRVIFEELEPFICQVENLINKD